MKQLMSNAELQFYLSTKKKKKCWVTVPKLHSQNKPWRGKKLERERSRIVSPFFQRIVDTRQSHLDRKAQYHWFASLQFSVKVSFKWLPIEKFKIQAIHFMHTSWFLNWCYWCHYLINPAPAPASQKNTPPWPWYVLVKLYHLQYHERLHIAY